MRNQQNIFDNETFFQGYRLLRANERSANNVEEKPALFSLLPDLNGKRILDLGCGYGENCKKFAEMGASYVLGIDISTKMLEIARQENARENVEFQVMNMEDIGTLTDRFDIVISSLALHYIHDYDSLVDKINSVLVDGGYFIFTQEHPIATAPKEGVAWRMHDGYVDGMLLTDYAAEGQREVTWFVNGVVKFHRRTDTILNTLTENGFALVKVLEPTVSEEIIAQERILSRCRHAPDYLMVKARKLPRRLWQEIME